MFFLLILKKLRKPVRDSQDSRENKGIGEGIFDKKRKKGGRDRIQLSERVRSYTKYGAVKGIVE